MLKFEEVIAAKPEPNLSMKLQPPTQFPFHHHKCPCDMCNEYEGKVQEKLMMKKNQHLRLKLMERTKKSQDVPQKLPQSKVQEGKQKTDELKNISYPFQFVLKRLLLPKNKIITESLGVFIPEICFYKNGEADSLYMNVDLNERTEQQKKQTKKKERKQLCPACKERKQMCSSCRNKRELCFDCREKRQECGNCRQRKDRKEPTVIRIKKQKLSNTQIQKIINEKRRKYRQKVGTLTKKKLSKRASYLERKEAPPETKDAIIVKYLDGYEEIRTQNQFISLTLKRKQDPIFKSIDFIKNFIGVEQEDKRVIIVKHSEGNCKYEGLFKRAKTLMRVYGTNIQPNDNDYISKQDQYQFGQKLLSESWQGYCYYNLYKILNYIEYFYDDKITLISVKFLLNECRELYLLHVYKLESRELVKYSWTHAKYIKKVVEAEETLLEKNYSKSEEMDQEMKNRSNKIEAQMTAQYQSLKYVMGLAHVEQNDSQERANNSFFAKLHPQLTAPLSQIMKDKTINVHKFQQHFLGYRNHKKSVAQPFNSNLVKAIHKMAPQLKVASPHQIIDTAFPRTPQPTQRSGKRSFSMGNTISSLHKTLTIFT